MLKLNAGVWRVIQRVTRDILVTELVLESVWAVFCRLCFLGGREKLSERSDTKVVALYENVAYGIEMRIFYYVVRRMHS